MYTELLKKLFHSFLFINFHRDQVVQKKKERINDVQSDTSVVISVILKDRGNHGKRINGKQIDRKQNQWETVTKKLGAS